MLQCYRKQSNRKLNCRLNALMYFCDKHQSMSLSKAVCVFCLSIFVGQKHFQKYKSYSMLQARNDLDEVIEWSGLKATAATSAYLSTLCWFRSKIVNKIRIKLILALDWTLNLSNAQIVIQFKLGICQWIKIQRLRPIIKQCNMNHI